MTYKTNESGSLDKMAKLSDDDLMALMESGSLIHSSLDSQEVFSMIMENTNKVAGSIASTLFLLDEQTGELVFRTPTGPMADKLADQRIKKGRALPVGSSTIVRLPSSRMQTRPPVFIAASMNPPASRPSPFCAYRCC